MEVYLRSDERMTATIRHGMQGCTRPIGPLLHSYWTFRMSLHLKRRPSKSNNHKQHPQRTAQQRTTEYPFISNGGPGHNSRKWHGPARILRRGYFLRHGPARIFWHGFCSGTDRHGSCGTDCFFGPARHGFSGTEVSPTRTGTDRHGTFLPYG